MATFDQHTQSGGATSRAFSIPSFTSDEIKVRVGNVLKTATTHYNITNYTVNGGTVTWTSGNVPANGSVIRIYRDTKILNNAGSDVEAQATYQAGSAIKQDDLNDNQKQVLRALEEKDDQFIQTFDVEPQAIDGTKIADDSIDSQHYAAGSIDLEHMSANSVDSDQYVDGSVDLIHLAANSVDTSKIVDGTITNADISSSAAIDGSKLAAATGSAPGAISAANQAKLDAIEAGATADQSNAEIRAAVEAASDSNVFTDADHSKLNAIEASATADQTAAEIRTLVESASDSNVFTDADHTKLNAIAASANNYVHPNHSGEVTSTADGAQVVADNVIDEANLKVDNSPTNDYVLTAKSSASGGLTWAAASGGGGGGGTAITIQDEGSALSTAASTINFVGAGVTASGTGTTKTITISGSGGSPITTDYQYLELKAHNNASGAFSAGSADYELVTKGTTTAVSPDQAAAMLISIAGVLQEPNTGTSIGSNDGFCIDGSSIHFGANLTAHPDYIIWMKGSGSHTINDDSVTEAKLDIHNAPSGTDKYLKYTSNGMEWATATGGVSDIVDDTSPQLGGALDVQAQEINTSTTNGNIKLTPNGTGVVEVKGNTNPGTIQLNCENNSHGVKIKGPAHSASASYTLTLPDDDGSANQVLKTDGSGNLAWVAQTTDTNTQLSNAEVRTAVEAASDSNVFTDADHTKLNAIAASANNYAISSDLLDEDNMATNSATKVPSQQSVKSYVDAHTPSFEIFEHANALSANKTIGTNNNALVAGPFSTGSYTLTIPSGSVFTVV